jgi:hypothetical protein
MKEGGCCCWGGSYAESLTGTLVQDTSPVLDLTALYIVCASLEVFLSCSFVYLVWIYRNFVAA